jgi:hypothetical protein
LVPACVRELVTVAVPVPEQSGVLTLHRPDGTAPVWLSKPSQNTVPPPQDPDPPVPDAEADALVLGDAETEPAPAQETPLSAKFVGTAFVPEKVAWKPKVTVAPVASEPL